MRADLVPAAAALCAAALYSSGAQAAPKLGERVAITGCPYAGVTAACLMLNGADGTVYNISGIIPRPRPIGRMIWLRGTVTDKPSLCAQGVVLDRIRWTRVRQRCSN
jgi:hypothetical protein